MVIVLENEITINVYIMITHIMSTVSGVKMGSYYLRSATSS